MGKLFLSSLAAFGLAAVVGVIDVSVHQTGSLAAPAFAQETGGNTAPAQRRELNAEIDVNTGSPGTVETRRTTWFVDPLWVGLAAGALILIVVLFAAGSRTGGTTTIIKD